MRWPVGSLRSAPGRGGLVGRRPGDGAAGADRAVSARPVWRATPTCACASCSSASTRPARCRAVGRCRHDLLVRLPESMSLEHAALVEPTAVAVHDVRRSGLVKGETAVVVGGGPVGLLIATVAANTGADVTGRRARPLPPLGRREHRPSHPRPLPAKTSPPTSPPPPVGPAPPWRSRSPARPAVSRRRSTCSPYAAGS